ncbi:MAG: hypothetical protein ACRER1_05690 [Gammaproteobacteria bacterium]
MQIRYRLLPCLVVFTGVMFAGHTALAASSPKYFPSDHYRYGSEDCGAGNWRALTSQEKTYFANYSGVRNALPAAPAGWQLKVIPDAVRAMVCVNDGAGDSDKANSTDYTIEVLGEYSRAMTADDRNKYVEAETGSPRNQKQMDALTHDRSASVRIAVNFTTDHMTVPPKCGGAFKKLDLAGGTAYLCPVATAHNPRDINTTMPTSYENNTASEKIIAMFGFSKADRDENYTPVPAGKMVFAPTGMDSDHPMQMHNVLVTILSDNPARSEQLFKSVNFRSLQKLLH